MSSGSRMAVRFTLSFQVHSRFVYCGICSTCISLRESWNSFAALSIAALEGIKAALVVIMVNRYAGQLLVSQACQNTWLQLCPPRRQELHARLPRGKCCRTQFGLTRKAGLEFRSQHCRLCPGTDARRRTSAKMQSQPPNWKARRQKERQSRIRER